MLLKENFLIDYLRKIQLEEGVTEIIYWIAKKDMISQA